ncbi:MAG: hypothetical protein M3Z85_07390 [Acidobacteriota bacterium]|nr:hypothetical protein [Acidobacteriota bacterium]
MIEFIRKALPYTAMLCGIAVLYVGWTFFSRWNSDRELREAAEAQKIETLKKENDLLGGGKLKIMSFYADPAVFARGQRSRLCYGVANAKTARIEPGVERISPSLGRCVDVAPIRRDTTYTLTAEDANGHAVTQSLTVRTR